MDIAQYTAIISCVFSFFFLSIVAFNEAYKLKQNIFVLLAIIVISLLMVMDYAEKEYLLSQLPRSFQLINLIRWIFLFPVLIFLFLQKETLKYFSYIVNWRFLLPFFIFSILKISFNDHWQSQKILPLTEDISLLLFSIYLFYFNFKKLQEKKETKYDESVSYSIGWCREILILSMGIIFFYVSFKLNKVLIGISLTGFINLLKICVTIYCFRITYKGINELRDNAFYFAPLSYPLLKLVHEVALAKEKPRKANDSSYLLKIQYFIEEEKIFKDPMLSRNLLADKLGISHGYLSEIINTSYNCNFNQFINQYRIEEAINLLKAPEYAKFNIESIGYEVGFNSKTSFYQAFRKVTGTTPSKYLGG